MTEIYFLKYSELHEYKLHYTKILNIVIKKLDSTDFKNSKQDMLYLETLDNIKEDEFSSTFIEKLIDITKNIKIESTKDHTKECVLVSTFDILFKYTFDTEDMLIFCNCCSPKSIELKKLQFDILTDNLWYLKYYPISDPFIL